MDYETIINCFIAVFQDYKDDSKRKVFVVHESRNDFAEFVQFLNDCAAQKEWHISYNGLAFDAQISQKILSKQYELLKLDTAAQIKFIYDYAQSVIDRSSRKEFQEFSPKQMRIRQIDLFKMNHWDNKAKMSSLKWIQFSMDWQNVEEMPHHHYEPITDANQLSKVIDYCINDVLSTKMILEHSKEQIQLRQNLSKEYEIDLYSASEPRISKELFLHFLSQKTQMSKADIKLLRTPRSVIYLGQVVLPYIQFRTPEFNAILEYFRTKVITSTKDAFKYTLQYKGMKTDYGLGGIHGARDAGIYEAKAGWTIVTSDVVSFYPNLAIRNQFAPEHLPKSEFCELYEWFFEERKKIPKSDPKNYVFKIILNSTYGLTGDENSFLYDPLMTMQITINGQLSLSMLYEMVCEEIPEAIPLMQNTDGFETMIPTEKLEKYYQLCEKWEVMTQLQLEHDEYQKMVIRDVNNYIAVAKEKLAKPDEKENLTAEQVWNKLKKNKSYLFRQVNDKFYYTPVKCKGAFEWEDLDKKKVAVFHKNKSFLIIPKAIHAYFTKGTSPEEYLDRHQDIFDYVAGVKAKGNWFFEERYIEQGDLKINRLQKIVRYYISNGGVKLIKCNPDGRQIQVESGEWMQTVINKIDPNTPLDQYDINKTYYLDEIYKQINQIEAVKSREFTQLSLF